MNEEEKEKKKEEREKDRVVVEASLVEQGDYLKFHLADEQPALAHAEGLQWYARSRLRENMSYKWRNSIGANIGRMYFESGGDMMFPTIPNFEAFARAIEIDATPAQKVQKKHEWIEEPIPQEEIIRRVLEGMKKDAFNVSKVKQELAKAFREGMKNEDVIEARKEEKSLNFAIEHIFSSLETWLIGSTQVHAKRVKLFRKTKRELEEEFEVPHLKFTFEDGLEIHMEGQAAHLFNILLPTIKMLKERLALMLRYRNKGVSNGEFDYDVQGQYEPFDHQKVMYKIHTLLRHSANLSQMGTGKTFSVLMAIDKRFQNGEIRPGHVLVICPAMVLEHWVNREIKVHTPHLKGKIITGSYNERLDMILNRNGADIFLTNFETFSMKTKMEIKGKSVEIPLGALFSMAEWDLVVIDEAHKIKNPEAQRTVNIINTFKEVPYSIIMSGTINANKLYDVHAPFVFLNGAKQFNSLHYERGSGKPYGLTKLHEQFVSRYFQGSGWKLTPRHFTVAELKKRMEEISVRYEKKECFSLPEKMYEQRMIDMEEKQSKLYFALKDYLAAQLSDLVDSGGTVSIFHVFSLMMKLAEAANGWIYDDNHQLIDLPENPKRDALLEYVSDLAEEDKVVIWSQFTNDLHLLYKALKEEYGEQAVAIIHGGESCRDCPSRKSERYHLQQRFNDLKDPLRFMVINSAVGSHGIDLVGATYELFFSNSFSKTNRYQAEERCHRLGMREALTVVDFVMKGTVDEEVLLAMRTWKSMSMALLGHFGIKPESIGLREEGKKEAPVIVDHVAQRPGECALATLAMLSSKPVELVRSWMTVQLNDSKAYKGRAEQIMMAVNHFLPEMAEQWKEYCKHENDADLSQSILSIPEEGTGAVILNHERRKTTRHAIAYSEGFVYDPGRMGKIPVEEYEEWMRQAKYLVTWVFRLPGEMKMELDEGEEKREKGEDNVSM